MMIDAIEWAVIPGTAEVRDSGKFPGFTGVQLGNGAKPDPEAGSDENWPAQAAPLEIESFELATYPVTVAQFRPFVEKSYLDNRWWSQDGIECRGDRTYSYFWNDPAWTLDNHPVIGVTWYDADAYCHWLNYQLRLPPGTIRLPTEAEWEWVARGPKGRRYPWGDEWEAWRCNSKESDINCTSAVGCFPGGAADWWRVLESDTGVIHDLAGNVWEWTASEYTDDYRGAHRSMLNTNSSGTRAARGGAWDGKPLWLRGAARDWWSAYDWDINRGFRLAKI